MENFNIINLDIAIHLYASDQFFDNPLQEGTDDYGIFGEELWKLYIQPLQRYKRHRMTFSYSEDTTIKNLRDALFHELQCENNTEVECASIAFEVDDNWFFANSSDLRLQPLLAKYLDKEKSGVLKILILINCEAAGELCREGSIRYYMHSHEAGKHNEPHVHVEVVGKDIEATIALSDGRLLAGEIPAKYYKKAKSKIENEKDYFFNSWCAKTDGLIPDINHYFSKK